jgi:hypothetical protein
VSASDKCPRLTVIFAGEAICKKMVLYRVLRKWWSHNERQKIFIEKEEADSTPRASRKAQAPKILEDWCDFDWISPRSGLFPLAAAKKR